MEKVIQTVYGVLYQKTKGVSYREQVIVTLCTVGFIVAFIIPIIYLLTLYFES